MDDQLLPTFFVIGASKSGTTALHEYLALHPEIAMTEPKEPHVMVGPDFRSRAAWYTGLFRARRPIRGESSTGYSVAPTNAEVPANIAELVPDARLVYLVRDPLERALAHYAQELISERERLPIDAAIRPDDPTSIYVAGSCYATQLEGYLRHFSDDAMLVVDSRRLMHERRETLSRILAHVGADPDFWDPACEREHMVRGADNVQLGSRARRLAGSRIGGAYRRLVPAAVRHRLRAPLRRALGGRALDPGWTDELRERLVAVLGPEAERLRGLTGERFEGWSV